MFSGWKFTGTMISLSMYTRNRTAKWSWIKNIRNKYRMTFRTKPDRYPLAKESKRNKEKIKKEERKRQQQQQKTNFKL